MDYKLAQQLKDAGFPQYEDQVLSADEVNSRTACNRRDHRTFDLSLLGYPKTESDYYTQGKWRPSCIFSKKFLESDEAETLYFPNLEELIEACGPDFLSLEMTRNDGSLWNCHGGKNGEAGHTKFDVEGSTPTEAVVKLLLELKDLLSFNAK